MATGYSGTPLAKKLSLKDGQRVWWENMPAQVEADIRAADLKLSVLAKPGPGIDAAHVFVTSRADLSAAIRRLLPRLAPAGFIWISWPKKASTVSTDVTEDVIREVALPTGLVDVKACAVDQTWSGLKLMIRKERR